MESIAGKITDPIKPGPPDLIPGFLPKRGQLVLAGETNIGKSLIALEVCSALTTGGKLWSDLAPTEHLKRVVYVLGEHYDDIIRSLWQKTQLPMGDEAYILGPEQLSIDKWLVNSGKRNEDAVKKFIKWTSGAELVVFDPLSSFIVGGEGTENDNLHMRLLLDTMSFITQSNGASCLVLAHQGKPSIGKDGQEHSRSKYAIRGASGIEDAATNIFYMGRADGNSRVAETRDSKMLVLRKRKYKGEAPDEYRLVRNNHNLTHTLLGDRPYIEIRQLETQSMYARFASRFPDSKQSDLIMMIEAATGQSESSIRRALELK